jgi:hypothetical protein
MSKENKYSFRAKSGRDDVIINWLESIQSSDKSYYIREALRDYLAKISFKESNPVDMPNSRNAINNKYDTNTREEVDVEVSASKLEANFNSWLD